MLLAWEEVNLDRPDNFGQTPLNRAASLGHKGVVKILLDRKEVNPTGEIILAKHRARSLLRIAVRRWKRCYSPAKW